MQYSTPSYIAPSSYPTAYSTPATVPSYSGYSGFSTFSPYPAYATPYDASTNTMAEAMKERTCTDHLDEYHRTLIQAETTPRVWRYQGPPENLSVRRGLGWVFPTPTTYSVEPASRRITDQNGVPILNILQSFGGFKLFDFKDSVLAKSDGSKSVWCMDTPSRKYALRKGFPTYYDLTIERSQKTMPLVYTSQNYYRGNWGALFPPICTACITDDNGDIMATIQNYSGSEINSKFVLTVKEHENVLLYLLVTCHMVDFIVQHCANNSKTAEACAEQELDDLVALDESLQKWSAVGNIGVPMPAPAAPGVVRAPLTDAEQKEKAIIEKAVNDLLNPKYQPPVPKYDFLASPYFHPLSPFQERARKRGSYF
jgi:hypothetical protein